jgi:hypothetical protein
MSRFENIERRLLVGRANRIKVKILARHVLDTSTPRVRDARPTNCNDGTRTFASIHSYVCKL